MKKELFIFFILPFQLNRGTYLRRISIKKDLFYPHPLSPKALAPLATLPPGHGVHPSPIPFPTLPSPCNQPSFPAATHRRATVPASLSLQPYGSVPPSLTAPTLSHPIP